MFFAVPLICILAICLGIWYEKRKEVERRGRKVKYLVFSVIGLLSFFGGLCLGEGVHLGYLLFKASGGPLAIFPFALMIYALLFSLGLYLSKERSPGFVLKAFGISLLFLFLAFYGFMAYGAHEHYYAKHISVHKVSAPSDYLNLTVEELEQYPALKEAIVQADEKKMGVVNVHPEEWKRIGTSLGRAWLQTIKIGDEYYKLEFLCRLTSKKLPEVPKEYVSVTEEEFEGYSILKKAKERANKFVDEEGHSRMSISINEWLQLEDFFDQKGEKTIEIGREYYEFELISELRVQKYYATLTEEELDEYPSLKNAIEAANKSEDGRAGLKVHPDEWERISDFLSEKGSHNIRVGDEYYEVGFICA